MKRANKVLSDYGLARKTYGIEKEVVAVLKKADWPYMAEKIEKNQEVEKEQLKETMNFFLEETGCLCIINKELFIQSLDAPVLMNEVPESILQKMIVYYSYYFDTFLLSINADEIRNEMIKGEPQLEKMAKIINPEYELKKLFNMEEEQERAAELIDRKINEMLQEVFDKKLKPIFYERYIKEAVLDADELVKSTHKKWRGGTDK